MATPRSEKRLKELKAQSGDGQLDAFRETTGFIAPDAMLDTTFKIKPIECCNEFVAVLQVIKPQSSSVIMPEDSETNLEGVVIGVGPGIPNGNGGRCPSQFKIGDSALFIRKNIALEMEPRSGFYSGKKILIISERSFIVKLPPQAFEIVDAE
jgi:co-chaperonin GroES (HSP10)